MYRPKLQLAPHELASNRRADWDSEPFSFLANWCGQEREFAGQVVGQAYEHMMFFALADEPELGNFVSAPIMVSSAGAEPIYEPRTRVPTAPEAVLRVFELTANEGWGRLYYLDEQLNLASGRPIVWRLFLAQSGWGQWSRVDNHNLEPIFRWDENADRARQLALLPPLELWNRTCDSLLDEQGDSASAREFTGMRADARRRACRPVTRGSYDEWEQILQWYLQSCCPFSIAENAKIVLLIHDEKNLQREGWKISKTFYPFSASAAQFCGWTRHYFVPQLDADYLTRCTAAAQWSGRAFDIRATTSCPTQHERLESLLQLRDWLADKAAPAEIEELLRVE